MYSHDQSAYVSAPDELFYEVAADLREQVDISPQVPGVYTFHNKNNRYPLYIGKSINIRARLLSHLRNPKEIRLLKQTTHISYIPTAGEISALLLEAQMIKQQQPLFNRMLRQTRETCSFVLSEEGLQIHYADQIPDITSDNIYGLFKNQFTAKDRLRELADEYGLCLSVLGYEPPTKGKGCFRFAIYKCVGACCGNEDLATHNQRLRLALEQFKIAAWPYSGAIALKESFGRLRQFHVLNNWRYHGSYKSEKGMRKFQLNKDTLFDADMYRILVKPILHGTGELIELSV